MTDTQPRLEKLIDVHLDADSAALAQAQGREWGDLKPVEDLRADSLDMVELVMAIEEDFGIEITDEEADPHCDGAPLAQLVELIDRKREKVAG
jgi:acyl carrier protein